MTFSSIVELVVNCNDDDVETLHVIYEGIIQ